MTAPALAAGRFLRCLAVGLALGFCYGFLHPPRRRMTALADGIFVVMVAAGWIYCGFGICQGDLRLGAAAGLLLGILAWEMTVGRLLRPIIGEIWKIPGILFRPFAKILDFFRKNAKKHFASGKKWVTINWCKHHHRHINKGGARHASH